MSEIKHKKLAILAQDIMDMYYQDFKEDEENHFDLDFFKRQVLDAHARLLREEYLQAYAILRSNGGHLVEVVCLGENYITKKRFKLEKDDVSGVWKVKLGKVFSFPYDNSSTGIQDVTPIKYDGCVMVRSKRSKQFMKRFQPETTITRWWPEINEIFFDKNCCSEVNVFFIPDSADDSEINPAFADMIKDTVLDRMFRAKNGNVIDQTNDGNKNAIPQTEINKENLS